MDEVILIYYACGLTQIIPKLESSNSKLCMNMTGPMVSFVFAKT
jgi:hypothetical protein